MVIKALRKTNMFSLVTFWGDFCVIYTVLIPMQIPSYFTRNKHEKIIPNAAVSCYGKTSKV